MISFNSSVRMVQSVQCATSIVVHHLVSLNSIRFIYFVLYFDAHSYVGKNPLFIISQWCCAIFRRRHMNVCYTNRNCLVPMYAIRSWLVFQQFSVYNNFIFVIQESVYSNSFERIIMKNSSFHQALRMNSAHRVIRMGFINISYRKCSFNERMCST